MVKQVKGLKVELEWKFLERIAEFYNFPTVVFLSNLNNFKPLPKTREVYLKVTDDGNSKNQIHKLGNKENSINTEKVFFKRRR